MPELRPILALIPARGGSKGLPGKNIRPLAGRPLIAHSVACAQMCPEVDTIVCSTDSREIADAAQAAGARVPFLRPDHLAADDTPMWAVIQHTLAEVEKLDGVRYESLLLLDPTSPARLPADICRAVELLTGSDADGIISVSEPHYSPIWHTVVEENGILRDFVDGSAYSRRQDVPPVYVINGSIYLWRRDFIFQTDNWRKGRMLKLETPARFAMSIDNLEEFEDAQAFFESNRFQFPWKA